MQSNQYLLDVGLSKRQARIIIEDGDIINITNPRVAGINFCNFWAVGACPLQSLLLAQRRRSPAAASSLICQLFFSICSGIYLILFFQKSLRPLLVMNEYPSQHINRL